MQYAYMELFNDNLFLVDAREMSYIDQIFNSENPKQESENADVDPSEDDSDYRLAVVYGCYMPQANADFSHEEKKEQIRNAVKYALVSIHNSEVNYLCLQDVKIFDDILTYNCGHTEQDHESPNVPLAALVQIPKDVEVGASNTQAVSAFLRYKKQMDLTTNLLNREGLFALKAEEKRIPKTVSLNEDNWMEYIDTGRAIKTAQEVI